MTAQLQNLTFIQHDNGIYELVLHKNNRQTVDELLHVITEYIRPEEQTEDIRLLLDQRETGVMPIRYLTSKIREYQATQKRALSSRTAILYKDNSLLTLMQGVMKLFPMQGADTFTFIKEDHDKAVAWLLQKELEVTE